MMSKSTIPNLQKEIVDVYEQASRAWLVRVKSEVDLWSDLAGKLTASHSFPEAHERIPAMSHASDANGAAVR
jgi:hypothetical protein